MSAINCSYKSNLKKNSKIQNKTVGTVTVTSVRCCCQLSKQVQLVKCQTGKLQFCMTVKSCTFLEFKPYCQFLCRILG